MAIRGRERGGRQNGRMDDAIAVSVLEAAPDAIVVLDGNGRVLELNPAAERTLGKTREAITGGDFAEPVIAPADRPRYRTHLVAGRPGRIELSAIGAGGAELAVELTTAPTDAGGRPATSVFIRDIADRQVAQGREQAVAGLGRRGLEGADLSELFRDAAETIAKSLDVALAVVLERTDKTTLALRAWSGVNLGAAASAAVAGSASPERGYALRADEPVVIEDWRTEKRFEAAQFLRGLGIRSGASVVIEGRSEEPFGVLAVHATQPGRFGGDEVYFLEAVANVLAAAIERSRTEEVTIHRSLHDPLTGLPNRALLLRPPRPRARRGRAARRPHAGGPLPRPRPLQGDQRQPRATRPATSCCIAVARAPARRAAPGRHRRALRRRRVRDPLRATSAEERRRRDRRADRAGA